MAHASGRVLARKSNVMVASRNHKVKPSQFNTTKLKGHFGKLNIQCMRHRGNLNTEASVSRGSIAFSEKGFPCQKYECGGRISKQWTQRYLNAVFVGKDSSYSLIHVLYRVFCSLNLNTILWHNYLSFVSGISKCVR